MKIFISTMITSPNHTHRTETMLSSVVVDTVDTFSHASQPEPLAHRELHEAPQPKCSDATKNAVKDSVEFTTEAASLYSSKYSALCQGIIYMNSRDTFRIGQGMGFLMLCAVPVLEPLRLGLATVGTVLGAGATVATGLAHGVVKTGEAVGSLAAPSETKITRQKFTDLFIERMKSFLLDHTISPAKKAELIAHPEPLIAMGVIAVAFNSRSLRGKQLNTGFGTINADTIQNQARICKTYFDYVCSVKDDLQQLELDNTNTPWDTLIEMYTDLCQNKTETYPQDKLNTMVHLVNTTVATCELFVNDPYFRDSWQRANVVNYN